MNLNIVLSNSEFVCIPYVNDFYSVNSAIENILVSFFASVVKVIQYIILTRIIIFNKSYQTLTYSNHTISGYFGIRILFIAKWKNNNVRQIRSTATNPFGSSPQWRQGWIRFNVTCNWRTNRKDNQP